MRKTELLVRAAVANPNLSAISLDEHRSAAAKYFDVYLVRLPLPDFSGLPNDWVFAAQNQPVSSSGGLTREALYKAAHTLLATFDDDDRIILLSDDPAAHLGDEFDRVKRDVFCLNALEFSVRDDRYKHPRFAPFLGAVRASRVHSDPVLALMYSPYMRAKPVSGWRFFGRKTQLDQILALNENYVIVGPRRVGKTSLMHEAHRRLIAAGEESFFIDVQNCVSANDVVREILHKISPRDVVRSLKHHELLGETVLSNVLRRMTTHGKRTTLFLDELGNVIANVPKDDWSFLGVLRKFSQTGRLRFVVSCFQEYFLRQQQEFTGPLINFASTMRLRVFTRKDVEEFLLAPLRFWATLQDREERALVDAVVSRVGTHPFLLQYFSSAFFQHVAAIEQTSTTAGGGKNVDLVQQANALLNAKLVESFESAVDELFFRLPSPLLQYLFIRRCKEAETANERLDQASFDYEWVESALASLGLYGSFQSYRNILEALEMHSLCTAVTDTNNRMVVAAPVIYTYVQRVIPSIDAMLRKLADDATKEAGVYGLAASGKVQATS